MIKYTLLMLLLWGCGKSDLSGSGLLSDPIPETPPTTPPPAPSYGQLEGKITDGQTGLNLNEVTLSVPGQPSTTTDGAGNYEFDQVTVGTVNVSVMKTGYIAQTPQVLITENNTTQLNLSLLTTAFAANKLVIVLTWGDTPTDLDSYLYVPVTASSTYTVNYATPGDQDGILDSPPFAGLDTDDTDGNGPETISISWDGSSLNYPRTYRYFVHNYSKDAILGNSAAQVRVYRNGALLGVFTVPANCSNDFWHVFDVASNSTLTSVNTCNAAMPAPLYQ
jgi:hypothetical protein